MTRDELKKIIKECLVEILAEGVGSALTERAGQARTLPRPAPQIPRPAATTVPVRSARTVDYMRVGSAPQKAPSHVSALVSNVTKDPLLASILADTAATTLVEQTEGRQQVPAATIAGDHAARVVAANDPGQLIGAMTGLAEEEQHARWAQAAFAPSKRLPGLPSGMHMMDMDPYGPFIPGK